MQWIENNNLVPFDYIANTLCFEEAQYILLHNQ